MSDEPAPLNIAPQLRGVPARKERRERIATEVLAAVLGGNTASTNMLAEVKENPLIVPEAVAWADALIAELDK